MHWAGESEKPPSLLTKTENQRQNWRKPANRTKRQNRKIFKRKPRNRTKNWPNPQNRKSQRPPSNGCHHVCLFLNYLLRKSVEVTDATQCPLLLPSRVQCCLTFFTCLLLHSRSPPFLFFCTPLSWALPTRPSCSSICIFSSILLYGLYVRPLIFDLILPFPENSICTSSQYIVSNIASLVRCCFGFQL